MALFNDSLVQIRSLEHKSIQLLGSLHLTPDRLLYFLFHFNSLSNLFFVCFDILENNPLLLTEDSLLLRLVDWTPNLALVELDEVFDGLQFELALLNFLLELLLGV